MPYFSANTQANVMAYMHIIPTEVMLLLCLPLPQNQQHLTWRSPNRSAMEPSIAAHCPTHMENSMMQQIWHCTIQIEHAKSSSLGCLLVQMQAYSPAIYYLNGSCT
jgi:hypothetical protein